MALDPNILKQRMGYQNKGMAIVSLIVGIIEGRGLDQSQRVGLMASYSQIILMILAGALETARAMIVGITPDGVMITQADLDEITGQIDSILA